jgi:hypothetical protein
MPDDIAAAAPAVTEALVAPAASVPVAPAGESVSSTPATTSSPTETSSTSSEATASPTSSPDAGKPANEFQPSLLDSATQPDSAPKPEGTADAAKPAEAKTDAPGETPPAPIKYEFTFPEGFDQSGVNSERMSAYTGLLGESKIAPEIGQKLLDMHLNETRTIAETIAQRQWDVFNEAQNKWRDEVMADPVLGQRDAEGKMPAISTIMSLVDLYGGNAAERQGLLDAFRITGAANNPHVLRFMHRAATALAREGTPHPAPPPRSIPGDPRERRMTARYGNTTPPR